MTAPKHNWSWLQAVVFLVRYNFALREVRALLLFVFGPVLAYALVYRPFHIRLTLDTVACGMALWLFACHMHARGPMNPFKAPPTHLAGKTVLITGGNTGLGRETALGLVQCGAHVIIACRDTRKAEDAVRYIRANATHLTTPDAIANCVEVRALDLASFASVRALAASLADTPLHVLINNAGVMNSPYRLTADGFEEHIGINHLGHMLLTCLLLDNLKRNAARIVTVASSGHAYRTRSRYPTVQSWLRPDTVVGQWWAMDRFWQYCNSKLANILFARHLERVVLRGSGAHSYVCHPGVIATELTRSVGWLALMAPAAAPFVAKTWTEGAQPSLYLATAPDARPATWYHDVSPAMCSTEAADDELAAELWRESAKCIGIDP